MKKREKESKIVKSEIEEENMTNTKVQLSMCNIE